ncbi:MAG: hypothetical protein LBN00_10950 [Oscillospiraceae bacterium]|jgi:hypothetical protein|nr:hypothetical protein [Oscillospiraceae bacterium]
MQNEIQAQDEIQIPEQTPTPCRRDCAYFSTYTESCDYTLIFYRSRPCPAAACTEFRLREERRSWQIYTGNTPFPRHETEAK